MTAWLAVPIEHVFCPTVRPEDGAPCHLLVHPDTTHVAGDGEGWTDTGLEEI